MADLKLKNMSDIKMENTYTIAYAIVERNAL